MNKKQQQETIGAFRVACYNLASAINEQLFDGSRKFYWVGGEVGGMCDFDDIDYLRPEEMVRIIDAGMTYDQYAEWRDANVNNRQYINLASWLKGLRHDMLERQTSKR